MFYFDILKIMKIKFVLICYFDNFRNMKYLDINDFFFEVVVFIFVVFGSE